MSSPSPSHSRSSRPERGPFPLGPRGPFELRALLGKGGMGCVYLAWERATEREVALKVILGQRAEKRLERFRREGQVTAKLHHPNVLRVHDSGDLDGYPYLVYELVEGARNLTEALEGRDLRERVRLLRDTARGLGYAHGKGVVHRDVKPDNVLVDREDRVRVADFGLATMHGQSRLTQTGAMIGTPHYMSPEGIAGGRDKVGPPSDVWALGVMLYEALGGERPYEGESLLELARKITSEPPPPLAQVAHENGLPQPDPALEAICRQALAREPSQRYRDARLLEVDLDAWLAGKPVSASTATGSGLSGLTSLPARSAALGGLALALLVLLALALLVATDGLGDDSSEPSPDASAGPGSSPPASPEPRASPTPRSVFDPAARLDADRVHRLLLRGSEGTPRERLELARRWLRAFPADPRRAGVEERRAQLQAEPVLVIPPDPPDDEKNEAQAAFVPGGLLVGRLHQPLVRCHELADGAAQRWTTGMALRAGFSGEFGVEYFAVLAEGWVAVAGNGSPLHWLRLGQEQPTAVPLDGVAAQQFTSNRARTLLVVAGLRGRMFVFAPGGRQPLATMQGPQQPILCLCFNSDESRLFAYFGHKDKLLGGIVLRRVWRTSDWEEVAQGDDTRLLPGVPRFVAASPAGLTVIGNSTGALIDADPQTGRPGESPAFQAPPPEAEPEHELRAPSAHYGSIKGIVFSSDGERCYSVSKRGPGRDHGEFKIWDTGSRQLLHFFQLRGPADYNPESLQLDPSERLAVLGLESGHVLVFDVQGI